MSAERLKKLRLTMTKAQYRRYHGFLEEIHTALEGPALRTEHRLFVAERLIAEKPVSIAEAMKL